MKFGDVLKAAMAGGGAGAKKAAPAAEKKAAPAAEKKGAAPAGDAKYCAEPPAACPRSTHCALLQGWLCVDWHLRDAEGCSESR